MKRGRDQEFEEVVKKRNVVFDKCDICLESIREQADAYFLPCCHSFHEDCVKSWLSYNVTCPDCRIPYFIQNEEQYDLYTRYRVSQKNDPDFIRQNIPISDNDIAKRFIKDKGCFDINTIEYHDLNKMQELIHAPGTTLSEIYEDILQNDRDEYERYIREEEEEEAANEREEEEEKAANEREEEAANESSLAPTTPSSDSEISSSLESESYISSTRLLIVMRTLSSHPNLLRRASRIRRHIRFNESNDENDPNNSEDI